MGVYAIRDLSCNDVRVLSSRNVTAAINRTLFELRLGSHLDKSLQTAWNQGGVQRVSIEVIELLKERADPAFDYAEELQLLLQWYRDELGHRGHSA